MEASIELNCEVPVSSLHQQIVDYQETVDKRFQELEETLKEAAQQLNLLQVKQAKKKKTHSVRTRLGCKKDIGGESLQHLKLNFPKFVEGAGVSEWIQDCEQYFLVFRVEDNKKVAVAGLHLQGSTRSWFQTQTVARPGVLLQWPEFCKLMVARFGAWEQELLHENFKQLQQHSTMEVYLEQFEKYQEQLKEQMPFLTEANFVECFIGGLSTKARDTLKLISPTTILQAYRLAKQCAEPEPAKARENRNGESTKIKVDRPAVTEEGKLASLQGSSRNATKQVKVIELTSRKMERRLEEWADFSNIQDLQHKNVSPGDISTDPYNVVQPSREEKYVEISVVDPYIFQSIGSSTTNCMMAPRNSLTWSTEDLDMPSVGNNSDEKFELNGHSLFFNGKGIYNGLDKKFSNFGKKNVMIIFDPGGDEPAGVFKVVKELFKQDLDEGVSVISTSDLLGSQDMIWLKFLTIEQLTKEHSELRKEVCKVQMLTSFGIQVVGDETDGVISDRVISEINQQYAQSIRADMKMITTYFVMRYGFHEMDVVMRLEDLKASRRCEVIYIFDPGGELSCLHGVLLDVITGILHFQQFLHDLLKGKDLFITEKESAGAEAFFLRILEDNLDQGKEGLCTP